MSKRKVTVTIDEDILDALAQLGSENVSSVMNEALRVRVEVIGRFSNGHGWMLARCWSRPLCAPRCVGV
jgi:hypothetical protein